MDWREVKERWTTERGFRHDGLDEVTQANPAFWNSYITFSSTPRKNGHLSDKDRELLYVAYNALPSHLFESGLTLKSHVRNALRLGNSVEEVSEVLQHASMVGIEACALGGPILAELAGPRVARREGNADVESLREAYMELVGFWRADLEPTLERDPTFFANFLELMRHPWEGPLHIDLKHLIYVVLHSAVVEPKADAVRPHIEVLLENGVSPDVIHDALEVVSVMSIHAYTLGLPVLLDLAAGDHGA